MFFSAIAAGLSSMGSRVIDLKVIPTPGVAYLAHRLELPAVVISASHNPYYDNGFKVFDSSGHKISADIESQIEFLINSTEEFRLTSKVGQFENGTDQIKLWEQLILNSFFSDFSATIKTETIKTETIKTETIKTATNKTETNESKVNNQRTNNQRINAKKQNSWDTKNLEFKLVVDCANGATSLFAEKIFRKLGLNVLPIFTEQNGYSINENCGAASPNSLVKVVVDTHSDLGLAFDGDGDRIVIVDETGKIIDGDFIIAFYAKYLKDKGLLTNNGVVVTSMTNLGFELAMKELEIDVVRTDVGDKNVLMAMLDRNYVLGGEQSGHIIRRDLSPTGDGLLNAIMLISLILDSGLKVSELFSTVMTSFPQKLANIELNEQQYANRDKILEDGRLLEQIKMIESKEGKEFRVVLRASGTEKLIRVMVEAKSEILVDEYLNSLLSKVKLIAEDIC
jgi:phosphoglucosamine mutase